MHGPCGPQFQICPHFGDGTTLDGRVKIHIQDDVAKAVRLSRRIIWRRWRNKALAMWEQAGLKFVVTEGPGEEYTWTDPAHPIDVWLSPMILPKKIRLVRNTAPRYPDVYSRTDFAVHDSGVDGSAAAFYIHREWWKRSTDYTVPVVNVICHEVGHCLGLDHGSFGVMTNTRRGPSPHDLESVSRYYLGYNWA